MIRIWTKPLKIIGSIMKWQNSHSLVMIKAFLLSPPHIWSMCGASPMRKDGCPQNICIYTIRIKQIIKKTLIPLSYQNTNHTWCLVILWKRVVKSLVYAYPATSNMLKLVLKTRQNTVWRKQLTAWCLNGSSGTYTRFWRSTHSHSAFTFE